MATSENDQDVTYMGRVNFRGSEKIFGIKKRDRRQHMYVIGMTGTGKTTLIENMVLQDIHSGRGLCVIDPHGEFAERVLAQIPPERADDVVYFNPVDSEFPIGFNILDVPDLKYKHLVVSDLMGIFTKIWANVWSARMEYIMQNCILALLDTPGTTLLGIPRILVDKDYRQKIVANVQDPVVRSFWINEYETWRDQFRNEAIVPIQNKVGQFLNTSFIRNIVGQPKSTLNVQEIMNDEKILLVNVSKGRIGEDNSQLLGAMIITKIQLAAMERVRIPEEDRKDFYMYVDEFQNFATESFASILSEARKYRLNLIIAHQYIGQLVTDVSTKVRDAVFGNVGTKISFRVGAPDAEFLATEYAPEFIEQDLVNLPNHTIYLRLMVDGVTSRPFSASTLAPLRFETDPGVKEKIIRLSRERYAVPREQVEDVISRWSGVGGEMVEMEEGTVLSSTGKTLFESPCWNCGKTATTPFKPDGKRPVYCLSCLKQIEEGKIVPLPDRMPKLGKSEKFSDTLGTLGIEFGGVPVPSRQGGGNFNTVPRRDFAGGGGNNAPRREFSGPSAPRREAEHPFRGNPRPPFRNEPRGNFPRQEGQDVRPQNSFRNESENRFSKPPFSQERRPRDMRDGDRRFSGGESRQFSEGERRQASPRPAPSQSEFVVRVPKDAKPMSLSALKSKEKKDEDGEGAMHPPKRIFDTKDLKQALAEALAEEKEKVTQTNPAPEKKDSLPPKAEKNNGLINPGETVRL